MCGEQPGRRPRWNQPTTGASRPSGCAGLSWLPAEEVSWLEFVAAQGFLDALDVGRGSGALIDGKGLPQVAGCFAGVAVLEVQIAESFQGARLLGGGVDAACDGERLAVVAAGQAWVCGMDGQLAE